MEYELINEIESMRKKLNIAVKELRNSAKNYAEAYTAYRIAIAKELIQLKDAKTPATLAYDIARGKPEIAKLKFEEICKEGIYKANQESIQAIKLEIRLLEAQLEREWENVENENR